MDISSSGKRQNGHSRRTLGNGRGSLGRIRTDFVEILKKGQEPIRTKFHFFFLKQPDPLSGRKSKFQDIRSDFISDRANPGKKSQKIGQIWKSRQYFLENLGEARYNPDKLAGPLSGQKVPFQDQASPTITGVL